MRIPFQRPELPDPERILAHFTRSVQAGWYSNGGPCARAFAAALEERLGHRALAVPVANATVGLQAALLATAGRGTAGRLVVTPSYTFTATACAIVQAGYEPLFVDIEPRGLCLDPDELDGALAAHRGDVAAVLACSPFGTAPTTTIRTRWREAADAHGIPLIIDSAPGFGALDEFGVPLGGQGDVEIFSFHATKTLAIGEGGAVTTPDAELAARVARLVNFGLDPATRTTVEAGLNGKLSELHAATGLAALESFDAVLQSRRRLARRMRTLTRGSGLTFQRGSDRSTWQYLQALAPTAAARDEALARAAADDVEVRTLHDPPLHRHAAFAAAPRHGALATTDDVASRSLSLPLANRMSDHELHRIAAVVPSRNTTRIEVPAC